MPQASSTQQVSSAMVVRVVKVGGSLLHRAELPESLQRWLADQPPGHCVLLSGGGELVESLRRADRAHQLGEVTSHWLAIAAMRVTARLLAAILPAAQLVETWSELHERITSPGVTILDAEQFLRQVEPAAAGVKLPENWDVTSDSIAARLAIVLSASELVLLKSAALRAADAALSELAASGYIDRFLPQLRDEIPRLRIVCLCFENDSDSAD